MPLKLAESETTNHFFGLPLQVDSKDILFLVKRDTVVEAYLTDKTCKLRAAAVLENWDSANGVARLVTNEKAAEKFNAELTMFAKEAEELPPTGEFKK